MVDGSLGKPSRRWEGMGHALRQGGRSAARQSAGVFFVAMENGAFSPPEKCDNSPTPSTPVPLDPQAAPIHWAFPNSRFPVPSTAGARTRRASEEGPSACRLASFEY